MRDTYIQSVNDAMSMPEKIKPSEPRIQKNLIISEDSVVRSVKKGPLGDIYLVQKQKEDSPIIYIIKEILPRFSIGESIFYYRDNVEEIGTIIHCQISEKPGKFSYQIDGCPLVIPEEDIHRESIINIKKRENDAKVIPKESKDFTKQNSENKHLINDVCRAAMISSQYDYYNSRYRGESCFEIMEGTVLNYDQEKQIGLFKPTQTMSKLLSSIDERNVPNFLSRKASRFAILLQEAYRDSNEPINKDAFSYWQKKYHGSQKDFLLWVLEKMEAEINDQKRTTF